MLLPPSLALGAGSASGCVGGFPGDGMALPGGYAFLAAGARCDMAVAYLDSRLQARVECPSRGDSLWRGGTAMSIFRAVAIAALSLLSAREAPANIIEADFPAPSPSAAILKTRCLPRSRRWRSRCARPGDYLRVSRIA